MRTIRIGSKQINTTLAQMTYRCAECLGPLKKRGFGLVCRENSDHRRFVHQNQAAEIEANQKQAVTELSQFYEIKNGVVTVKE